MLVDEVHIDSEVWLAGKGPSFDKYNWGKANKYRVGINHAAFEIPKCWAAIAYDYCIQREYIKRLNPKILVFKKSTHKLFQYANEYQWEKGREATNLCATATVALQLLTYLGAKKIHCIGFDSIDGDYSYARSFGDSDFDYSDINREVLKVVSEIPAEVIWEHRYV